MELCDTWLECTQHVKAWVLHFSNTYMVHGHIIDPQLPGLGQCAGIRTLRVTDIQISFVMQQRTRFESGQVYVVFGSLAPVWHSDSRVWMGQLPRRSPFAGAVKIAGQRPAHREYRVAELYAGAMGGWATSARELSQWTVKPLFALGEIENTLWTNLLNLVDVNVCTISPPCQSWSNIGSRSGTASSNGRTLMHTVQICRLLQPSLILFEQVAGFRQHDEFDQFIQAMQEAGFRVATSGVHDLQLLSYTSRRRWLAVFVNTLHVHRWDILGKWLHPVVRACPSYQPEEHWLALWTEEQRSIVSIKEEEFQALNDPDLLPRWQRGAPGLMSWVIRDGYGDIRWMGKCEDLFQPAASALPSRISPMDTYMMRPCGIYHDIALSCLTEQCFPSHFQVVQAKRLEDEGNELREDPVLAGAALYTAEDLDTGFIHEANCFRTPELGTLFIHEDLHPQTRFFHNQEMVKDHFRPGHGTHIHFKRFLRQDDACPLCLTYGMNTQLRLCLTCKRMGCKLCIVDKCDRCTNGKLTCRSCHEKAADSKLRALYEAVTLQVEQESVPIIPTWDWTLVCDIEAEWQLLTVMSFPTGRATIKRSQYYDGGHIIATVRAMGCQVEAIDSYIMVIPTSYLAWRHQVLSPDERDRGFILAYGEHNLDGETVFTLRAAETIRKIPPWREQERFLEAPDEGMEVLDELMEVSPVAQISMSGLGGTMPGTITNWWGVVMLDGHFPPLPLHGQAKLGLIGLHISLYLQLVDCGPHGKGAPFSSAYMLDYEPEPRVTMLEERQLPGNWSGCLAKVDEKSLQQNLVLTMHSGERNLPALQSLHLLGAAECHSLAFSNQDEGSRLVFEGLALLVRTKEAVHRVDLEPQNTTTMAIEVRHEYQQNWGNVAKNPMRFVWSCTDGLQRIVVSTWSRKFFSGKPDVASTWHMFLKVPGEAIEPFLRLSGKQGIFITPKASDTNNAAGYYRVIWLDHADLEKALTLQRAHPEIVGLVRGRDTLGVRVKVGDYSATRVKLEPTWSSQGLLTDIVVEQKWVVAPLPAHSDRGSLQQALIKLPWRAAPLKQVSATRWLVGSSNTTPPPTDVIEIGGQPLLITKQTARATRNTDQVVLAAPPAFQKSFYTEINKGRWQTPTALVSQSDAAMEQASGPPATARTLLAELRDEVNTRLGDFQAQIQTAVNQVNERVQEAHDLASTAAMEAEALTAKQDHRILQVENAVQQLSVSIVTNSDLTGALSAAMEQQSKELRALLAKGSADATPTSDRKAQRYRDVINDSFYAGDHQIQVCAIDTDATLQQLFLEAVRAHQQICNRPLSGAAFVFTYQDQARGMDGFSMAELKSMGEPEHEMLAALFNCVLRTGRWLQGLTSSFLSLLAKGAAAEDAQRC
ncbi:hypothetical protein AK812_SmicGene35985 [Symbiodinium microadriaticum]|uniref:DNA (cytosine-5-)-methyltransferase n=1 Tax=Symbiodinium microadriaticum TaxID=2951 RepID=A0A1Q9CK43_SYMMI|nr:hypothetical protein AK812_SmicGene35985 [Symbiodinium microadriaticum]